MSGGSPSESGQSEQGDRDGAGGGSRTLIPSEGCGILSPVRLPVPPLQQVYDSFEFTAGLGDALASDVRQHCFLLTNGCGCQVAFIAGLEPQETIAFGEPTPGRLVRRIAPGKGHGVPWRCACRKTPGGRLPISKERLPGASGAF